MVNELARERDEARAERDHATRVAIDEGQKRLRTETERDEARAECRVLRNEYDKLRAEVAALNASLAAAQRERDRLRAQLRTCVCDPVEPT